MLAMMTATRAEDGCVAYAYAEDVAEPGLIHVFEIWRDQAALDAHFKTPHMAAWRAAWPRFGVSDRDLKAYDIAAERADLMAKLLLLPGDFIGPEVTAEVAARSPRA